MGLLDSITGGSESRSFIDPAQAEQLRRVYGEAGRIYGETPTRPEFMGEYQQLIPAVQQGLLSTLGGEYLPGGEAFQAQMEAIGRQVMPQVASQFATGGRFGSGLQQEAVAQALADAGTRLFSEERGRQLGLLSQAPEIQSQLQAGYYETPYAALAPYRGILGPPTVMQESRQSPGLGGLVGFNVGI